MAMVAVTRNHFVSGLDRQLHADDDCFLADIEVTEAADEPHAVKLAGFFLESADEQHVAIGAKLLLLVELRYFRHMFGGRSARGGGLGRWFVTGNGHFSPRGWAMRW